MDKFKSFLISMQNFAKKKKRNFSFLVEKSEETGKFEVRKIAVDMMGRPESFAYSDYLDYKYFIEDLTQDFEGNLSLLLKFTGGDISEVDIGNYDHFIPIEEKSIKRTSPNVSKILFEITPCGYTTATEVEDNMEVGDAKEEQADDILKALKRDFKNLYHTNSFDSIKKDSLRISKDYSLSYKRDADRNVKTAITLYETGYVYKFEPPLNDEKLISEASATIVAIFEDKSLNVLPLPEDSTLYCCTLKDGVSFDIYPLLKKYYNEKGYTENFSELFTKECELYISLNKGFVENLMLYNGKENEDSVIVGFNKDGEVNFTLKVPSIFNLEPNILHKNDIYTATNSLIKDIIQGVCVDN